MDITNDIFNFTEQKIIVNADNLINQSFVVSKQLAKDFNFVRVDWIIYQNKLYFEELTFTPYSGFRPLNNKKLSELVKI